MTRRSVLVIAEAANPDWVSVPLVGWSLAHALRDVADVHLVTQIRNRDAIVAQGLVEGKDFTAIDSEAIARPANRISEILRMGRGKGWTMTTAMSAVAYSYFEHLVWQKFGTAIQAGEYDIVHRITPLSPTISSPIAARIKAANVPFILGPLNGGVPWPKGFDRERRREREWLSYIRNIYKILPGRQKTLNVAAAIIAGSNHTASEVPAKYKNKIIYIPENAVSPEKFNLRANEDTDISGGLKACFIGRMVPYKGPDMLLEASAPLLRNKQLTLDMIGDGPMLSELKNLAQKLEISKFVKFHGNLPHQEVQAIASQSNILTFPSIREFGGGVVLEAMALGLVPIVVDYAGPGELVTPETGYKIAIGTREQIIERLHDKLGTIVAEPKILSQMGKSARGRVTQLFTWQTKAQQVTSVYDWVLEGRDTPPPQPILKA